MRKIAGYLFVVIGLIGILASVPLMYTGSEPCHGDSCVVRIFLLAGLIILIVGTLVAILGILLIEPKSQDSQAQQKE